MPQPIHLVDAFTDRAFAGNPAGVCILDGASRADDGWMQRVAMEMNQAETAFVRAAPERGGRDYDLRWFTPTTEVDLCGHATLAGAHTLWETRTVPEHAPVYFHTKSGVLTCDRRTNALIEMDFPATPTQPAPDALDEQALDALGLSPGDVGGVHRSKFDVLVLVNDPEVLRSIRPDFRRVAKIQTRGAIVTSRSDDPRYSFLSRFFAPQTGIDEDPVTGSAHCALGPFWRHRASTPYTHEEIGRLIENPEMVSVKPLVGYQASKRGGVVHVTVRGDRVILGGHAVTTMRGELNA